MDDVVVKKRSHHQLQQHENAFIKYKLICIRTSHLKEKHYKTIIYSKSLSTTNNEFTILTYDTDLKEIKKYKSTFKGKIKLLNSLYPFNNSSTYELGYNPTFALIDLNFRYFIVRRFTDNTFTL